MLPPGHSSEQRTAERIMLDILGTRLGLQLDPARLTVPSGARVEVDGADLERSVLVECWAHQGKPKGGAAAQSVERCPEAHLDRLNLCLASPAHPLPLRPTRCGTLPPGGRSWAAQALADLDISIEIIELPAEMQAAVIAAQRRQYR